MIIAPRPEHAHLTRLLAGSQLFAGFPAEALGELAAQAVVCEFAEKEVIFAQGTPGSAMYAILNGRVKISTYSEDGREVIFAILDSGDFFGESALLDGLPRSATCTTLENCRLLSIERDSFIPFLEKNPALAIHLLALLSGRRAQPTSNGRIIFSPAVRLAATADPARGAWRCRRKKHHASTFPHECPTWCGSRESINKQLSLWSRDGLLTLAPRQIIIEDRPRLQQLGRLFELKD